MNVLKNSNCIVVELNITLPRRDGSAERLDYKLRVPGLTFPSVLSPSYAPCGGVRPKEKELVVVNIIVREFIKKIKCLSKFVELCVID